MLANVLTNENDWHSLKIRYNRRVFASVGNKFGTFASHSPPAYEYRPIKEASLKFQRMLRLPLVADNFRKHSQAIGNVGKAFGSICNVRKAFARRLWHSPFPIPCACLTTAANDTNALRMTCQRCECLINILKNLLRTLANDDERFPIAYHCLRIFKVPIRMYCKYTANIWPNVANMKEIRPREVLL